MQAVSRHSTYLLLLDMMRHGRTIAIAVADVILALLLQCAEAQTDTNATAPFHFNNITNVTYSTTIILFTLVLLFFLLSTVAICNRRYSAATNPVGIITRTSTNGLCHTILDTFPTFTYSEVKSHKIGKSVLECAICLNEFDDDEALRFIPMCDHVFHQECIDSWLGAHTTCPVCRANLDVAPEAAGTDSESGPSRTDEATTIDIAELPMSESVTIAQPEPTDHSKSPNRLFYYSMLSKSHSTGHLLVRSGDKIDRFTLILPIEIRNQIMNRALNRSNSDVVLPRESSLRNGYRTGGEEGSCRGRFSGPLGFGLCRTGWTWTSRPNWNYNTGEGTSRFVGPMSFQKLGLRKN